MKQRWGEGKHVLSILYDKVEIMQLKMERKIEKLKENKFIESIAQVVIGSQRTPLKTDH